MCPSLIETSRKCKKTFIQYLILFSFCSILENNGGQPPLTFAAFNQVAGVIGEPPKPVNDPDFKGVLMPVSVDHERLFALISLNQLGIILK